MATREQERELAAQRVSTHDLLTAVLRELHGISMLLGREDAVQDFNPSAMGVSDDGRAMLEQRDWPITGGRRWLLGQRQGYGEVITLTAAQVTPVLPANAARLGGVLSWSSAAAAPLTVYLAPDTKVAAGTQVPALLLAPGARWDFKLGDLVWCGSVTVQGGAFPVAVAEL